MKASGHVGCVEAGPDKCGVSSFPSSFPSSQAPQGYAPLKPGKSEPEPLADGGCWKGWQRNIRPKSPWLSSHFRGMAADG